VLPHRSARALLISCLFAISLPAQDWIAIGVKGGAPLTDPFRNLTSSINLGADTQVNKIYSGPRSFLIGPTIEVKLPFGLTAEADALYGQMSLRNSSTSGPTVLPLSGYYGSFATGGSSNLNAWEFPLLAKYRLSLPVIKPYLEAGPSFRVVSGYPSQQMSSKGISAGVGVELSVKHFIFSPELRYTHWGADKGPISLFQPQSETNQLEILAGISTRSLVSGLRTPRSFPGWRDRWFIGVKGGLPFTDAFSFDYTSNFSSSCASVFFCTSTASRNYLIGPMIGLGVWHDFSFEADALYTPLSLTTLGNPSRTGLTLFPSPSIQTFNAWQFSLTGIYKFPPALVRPFFEAGPTMRAATSPFGGDLSHIGITAGAGIESKVRWLSIAPEVRFVHWGHDGPYAGFFYASRQNQAQFLLGLSYARTD
jgi:hypothetical protein